nr:hypothetical protein [Tanacetum cinerariifolium]
MANLEFFDKHNMVAYLQKPVGSEAFHQIVHFLNSSHIRKERLVIFDDEEDLENSSKPGMKDEGMIQEESKIQGMTSADTEFLIDQKEPIKLVEDQGSDEKEEKEISTANIPVSTAEAKLSTATPEVSIAAGNLVHIRRSAEKRRDKGKAIMKEDESVQKKSNKEELRASMDIIPRDAIAISIESLATKYLIVDWKTHILIENMMYYQIIIADGSSKNYKIFSEMLDYFDRQDVIDLHRLVQERYDITSLEGYDLLLWGDLKILFEPNEEDEI